MTSPLLTSTILGDQVNQYGILDGVTVEQAAMTIAFMLEPLTTNSIILAEIEQDAADLLRGSARDMIHTIDHKCVELKIDAYDDVIVTVDRKIVVEWSTEGVRLFA